MLSRTASSLYWVGRYVERAEFTARLIEATIRLDALSARPAGDDAWQSALIVAAAEEGFAKTEVPLSAQAVIHYLAFSADNPSSIRGCLDNARGNARAVRTALSREAWAAINRAWLSLRGEHATDHQSTMALVDTIKAEARSFEGALSHMLRNESSSFLELGAAIERGDNTARLIDVKYHLLLPAGEKVGGAMDRDQWTTILHTVSAVTSYRWLYREGLKPWLVAELLIKRHELPRSLAASIDEVVRVLNLLGKATGLQGEADRLARQRQSTLNRTSTDSIFARGLHEYLTAFIAENANLHTAVGNQFRFA